MAQSRRNRPRRACRDRAVPIYTDLDNNSDPDWSDADVDSGSEYKMALGEKKRKRKQLRRRATSTKLRPLIRPLLQPSPAMDERLWRELPADVVEVILGHLPVHTLHKTVMALHPGRWEQILNRDTVILHHHNHVDSAIGQLKSYWFTWVARDASFLPPPPRAFDHRTRRWQTLPRFSDANVRQLLSVRSVSEGLLLLATPADEYLDTDHPHRMVTWNPVSQSHRWIGRSPDTEQAPYCEALVVDREKRSYKVIEFLDRTLPRDTCPMFRPDQWSVSSYTVYDSRSATWGPVQRCPHLMRVSYSRAFVCCEGCVLFLTVAGQHLDNIRHNELLQGVVCYDPTADQWCEALFPECFFKDLPGNDSGCQVVNLLYAAGRVLVIIKRARNWAERYFFIVSIRMSDVRGGVATFRLLGRLQVYPAIARSVRQAAPPCDSGTQPNEVMMESTCGSACLHWWYVLPQGRKWYLCVEFCRRWLRRFDLEAMVWEDEVVAVPCEEHHDRGFVGWDDHQLYAHRHAYIPGWVKV